MQLDFLEAQTPLTKTYTQNKQGVITKTPYPFVWEFTSHRETCNTIAQFEQLVIKHAAQSHCLLKGNVARPLVKESRAGSTTTNDQTEWVCLDFDGLDTVNSVHTVMQLLGLKDISYIVQHSASADIYDASVRAHVFMLLDKPTSAPLLKQWLIHLNHTVAELRSAMKLTKTCNSISWPLDISACQNDKLIYIAPPVIKGMPDPFKGKQRISLVKRKHERLTITAVFSTEKNRDLTNKRIAELRDAEGLPKRSFKYKMHGSTEIMVKPDSCTITEMKQERGFVYFNLNGGDSWAYYHPENNPEFIFNFKGEPVYLTKELLPEYWEQLAAESVRTDSSGTTYLAFCDRASSAYWRGTYDASTDNLELFMAKNETQIRHFAKQHGMPLGDFIPEWDLMFDPQSTTRVDFNARRINQFSPSAYMKAYTPPTGKGKTAARTIPKTILKVITHALGNDAEIIEHFINWLAYILQYRDRTTTSWVLHGTEGTGKGILTMKVLRPILGAPHCAFKRMGDLAEQYNDYMRNSLLVVVDEVQTSSLQDEEGVMAKVRNFITEEFISVRAMHKNSFESRNYTNWIFNSNKPDPVLIPKNDRRTNVAKYQPQRLEISDKEIDRIPSELQAFHDYLAEYPVSKGKAMSVLHTADRNKMISISESSIDTVSSAMLEGNFDFLMDQLPAGVNLATDMQYINKLETYKATLAALIKRTDQKTRRCSVSREELRAMYEFIIGNMPATPNKFTSLLKHHRIHIEKVWMEDRAVSGIKVTWADLANFPKFLDALTPKAPKPAAGSKVVPIAAAKKKA